MVAKKKKTAILMKRIFILIELLRKNRQNFLHLPHYLTQQSELLRKEKEEDRMADITTDDVGL